MKNGCQYVRAFAFHVPTCANNENEAGQEGKSDCHWRNRLYDEKKDTFHWNQNDNNDNIGLNFPEIFIICSILIAMQVVGIRSSHDCFFYNFVQKYGWHIPIYFWQAESNMLKGNVLKLLLFSFFKPIRENVSVSILQEKSAKRE